MAYLIRHAEVSEQGPKHVTNDDFYFSAPELKLYLVCDGVSGHSGGSTASRMAAETVVHEIRQRLAGAPFPSIQAAAIMAREAIVRASHVIFEKGSSDPALRNMATTLELVWQVGDHVLCAHTGDSRVYLWRRGKIQRLTKDHSYVQEMLDSGTMTEEQAKKSPYAHALVHAVGIQPTARVDLLAPEIQEGDVLLMCTDGICGNLTDGQIATVMGRAAGNLSTASHELVRGARVGGSTDDATVILLEVASSAQPQHVAPAASQPVQPPPAASGPVPPPLPGAQPARSGPVPPPLHPGSATPPPLHSGPVPPPLHPASSSAPAPAAPARSAAPLPQDKLNALDLSPCFGALSFADKTRLLEIAKPRRFVPGEVLAREGEISDQMWVLISGKVRITERGTFVADRVAPLTLGEAALMEQEPRAATMTVVEETHVLEFERARLLSFLEPFMMSPAAQIYRALATLEHKRMRELTRQLSSKSLG